MRMTKLGFTRGVHRPHGWAKRGLCLFWLLVIVLASGPLHAQTLYECDFETGLCGGQWINFDGERNSFSAFGISPLPGGGNACVAMKCILGQTGGSKLDCNYTAASNEVYIRFYIYFPEGYVANADYGVTLKLYRHTWPVPTEDADVKLGMIPDNNLRIEQVLFYHPYTGAAYYSPAIPSAGFARNKWHYFEAHYKHNEGNDVAEIWIDKDARTSTPDWSKNDIDAFEYDFPRVTMNINWSANAPATQQYYVDGLRVDNVPVGDTYGLLPVDVTAPVPPSGVSLSAP